MKPVAFPESNVVLAKDQPEYRPLPAHRDGERSVSCWALSWGERLRLLATGRLWLSQLDFGRPSQPLLPSVRKPPDMLPPTASAPSVLKAVDGGR